MPPKKKSIDVAAEKIDQYWDPYIIAELNGQHVRIAKLKGEFVWHSHQDADELFYVLSGELAIEFRDGNVKLAEGEIIVIPSGVEHRPVAEQETLVLLFEPADTVNTGSAQPNELTRSQLKKID
tara:strand:- start:699 stop:1070 length:372 start_codon:yes stop_codon:yes gene_type:complete